jgi:hypothetical protein
VAPEQTHGRRAVALQFVATLVLVGYVLVFVVNAVDVLVNRDKFDDLGLSPWHWVFVGTSYGEAVVVLVALGLALFAGGPAPLRRTNALLGAVPGLVLAVGAVVVLTTRLPDRPWFSIGAGTIVESVARILLAGAVLLLSAAVFGIAASDDEAADA